MQNTVSCKIEHHAILFALLAKEAILECGDAGKEAILEGMTTYGNERGARMAANALAHGDELNTMTNQAYGEWKPDYDGQLEFGPVSYTHLDVYKRQPTASAPSMRHIRTSAGVSKLGPVSWI